MILHVACRAVAEVASSFNIPLISWVATDPDLNDRDIYTTLSRTLGPFSKMGEFLLEIFLQYNWRRVVIINSNYLLYWDAAKAIKKVFRWVQCKGGSRGSRGPNPILLCLQEKCAREGRGGGMDGRWGGGGVGDGGGGGGGGVGGWEMGGDGGGGWEMGGGGEDWNPENLEVAIPNLATFIYFNSGLMRNVQEEGVKIEIPNPTLFKILDPRLRMWWYKNVDRIYVI